MPKFDIFKFQRKLFENRLKIRKLPLCVLRFDIFQRNFKNGLKIGKTTTVRAKIPHISKVFFKNGLKFGKTTTVHAKSLIV